MKSDETTQYTITQHKDQLQLTPIVTRLPVKIYIMLRINIILMPSVTCR